MRQKEQNLVDRKGRLLANLADSVNLRNVLRIPKLLNEESENAEMTEAMMKVSSISKFKFPFFLSALRPVKAGRNKSNEISINLESEENASKSSSLKGLRTD